MEPPLPLELERAFDLVLARPVLARPRVFEAVFEAPEAPFDDPEELRPRLDVRCVERADAPLPFEDFELVLRREAADDERPCEEARRVEPR